MISLVLPTRANSYANTNAPVSSKYHSPPKFAISFYPIQQSPYTLS